MNFTRLTVLSSFALCALPAFAQTLAPAAVPTPPTDESASQLDTITIIGRREALPLISGSAHLVDEAELKRYGYDDINRVLNAVPGVYVREEDGFGLRPNIGLRGGSSDRSQKVTLLEDGVLFGPAPYSAPAAYFFPLTARMTGVEVFKGPAAISQGPQTVGGAVNLLSAPIPDTLDGFIEGAGGTDAFRRVHARAGGPAGGFGLLGEFLHVASDGFKDLDGGGDTGFIKNEGLLKARHALGPGVLELRLGYADEESDETYLGLTEDDFRDNPNRRYRASALDHFDWDWNSVRADWQQDLLGGKLVASAYSHQFERAWRKLNDIRGERIRDVLANPDSGRTGLLYRVLDGEDSDPNSDIDDLLIGTNDRDFRSSGVQARQNWSFSAYGEHRLEAGARLHSDRVQRLHDQFAFELVGGNVLRANPSCEITRAENPGFDPGCAITADNTGRTVALALWLRDEITLGRWTFAPGLRVENIASEFDNRLNGVRRDNDYSIALPGLGINFAVSPALNLLAGVHKGFSPAVVGPGVDTDNGPAVRIEDPEPEEAINYEAGGRWRSGFGRVEVIGFFSDYSNLTATDTQSSGGAGQDMQTNAGKVEVYGVEAGYEHGWPLTAALRLPVALTYTYTHGEFKEGFTSGDAQFGAVEPGFELPYVPEHRANLRVGLDGARWSTSLSATYQSEQRDFAGEGRIEPGTGSDSYTVLDLAGRYTLTPHWIVTARADNLLDREYVVSRRPFGARPGKPLGAQLGIGYQF
ncbi:MAG: TonB-dependent receptor family protein [Panacagrimonas sp.]